MFIYINQRLSHSILLKKKLYLTFLHVLNFSVQKAKNKNKNLLSESKTPTVHWASPANILYFLKITDGPKLSIKISI